MTDVSTIAGAVEGALPTIAQDLATAVGAAKAFTSPVLVFSGDLNGGKSARVLTWPLTITEEYGLEALLKILGVQNDDLTETITVNVGHGAINLGLFWIKWRGVDEKVQGEMRIMEAAAAALIPEAELHIG